MEADVNKKNETTGSHLIGLTIFGVWGHYDPASCFAALAFAFISVVYVRTHRD